MARARQDVRGHIRGGRPVRPYVRYVRAHTARQSSLLPSGRKRYFNHEVKPWNFRQLFDGEVLVWGRTGEPLTDESGEHWARGMRVTAYRNPDGTYNVWKRNASWFDMIGSPGPESGNPDLPKEFGVTKERAKEIGDAYMEEEFFYD